MSLLARLFTRRRRLPRFADLPDAVRSRLDDACHELTEAEDRMAARLQLAVVPRLLLVDEEEAVVVTPRERADISAAADRLRR